MAYEDWIGSGQLPTDICFREYSLCYVMQRIPNHILQCFLKNMIDYILSFVLHHLIQIDTIVWNSGFNCVRAIT